MALVKCKECGEQVSNKAKTCPKCGAKAPRKTSLFTWLVLGFIIFIIYVSNQGRPAYVSTSPSNSAKAKITELDYSWTHSTSKDKMTGKQSAYAFSHNVKSTKNMKFPYSDVNAWLGIGCDSDSEWAYIGFSKAPNLNNTRNIDGHNEISTHIKWDKKVEYLTLTQKWGASFIHFRDDNPAINNILKSKNALLELDWHGQNKTYFEFSLKGSSSALKKIRNLCSKF